MKVPFLGLTVLASVAFAQNAPPAPPIAPAAATAPLPTSPTERVPLSTGRSIDPKIISSQEVGSLPVNMIASHDGKFAISSDGGFRQSLWSIQISNGDAISHLEFSNKKGKDAAPAEKTNGLYFGLVAGEGRIYAAQGAHDAIAVIRISPEGALTQEGSIPTRKGDFPAGLALDQSGRLYVANNDPVSPPPNPTPSSIAIYDPAAGQELGRFSFSESFGGTPNFPLAIAVSKDGARLYVASQRDSAVYVLDTSNPAAITQKAKIETGSHPVALLLNRSQNRLYVANAHSDTISFVDTEKDQTISTILLRPDIARSLAGATPTGLALSANEKSLYVTLGDMNALAVIDVPDRELDGYYPVGWYPTAIVASSDGKRILVSNAKGIRSRNPNPAVGSTNKQSPNNLLEGNVISFAPPTKAELKTQTLAVLENNRLTPKYLNQENPLKAIGLQAGKIKHVIYIVKENRTYDVILGDLPQGNGDLRYNLFGREITPNQHALAERFVLMDNFYDSGEVSGDGWTWSTQAMANEYTIRNVPYQYSGRGRMFDYEGTNNGWLTGGFPALGPEGKPLSNHPAFKAGAPAFPDVAEAPGGHLWDLARRHGLTFRNYGFFSSNGIKSKDGLQVVPDNYPASSGLQPGGHDLEGMTNVDFRKFDLDYPDSDAWAFYYKQTQDPKFLWPSTKFGKYESPSRFSEWNREFQMMLQKGPDSVPNLMTVRLASDHTQGANPKKKAPKAMVADNDYAVGQLIETVSKSPIWKSTAIFIIEDDAQDGPDHVDAHRSTCYVISPWIKKASIDHSIYTTASCLRTIELLLGLPPMCQYDAAAPHFANWDDAPNNSVPFEAIRPPAEIMALTNPDKGQLRPASPEQALLEQSEKMDFTVADRAPADRLNEILWKLSKGVKSRVPRTPKGIAGVTLPAQKDDDD